MTFSEFINKILEFLQTPLISHASEDGEIGEIIVTVGDLMEVVFILAFARFLVWFLRKRALKRLYRKREIDIGRQYAIGRFVTYVIYVVAFLWALQVAGVQLSVIWAGSAALLVGVGLGLQQTFNDLVCGIIILTEGTVAVGDIVVVDGLVGIVRKIGIRTSEVETRDQISIIIPNSKLVVNNVTNWSHADSPTRFQVKVGVAYSSDVELVKQLLLQAAADHPQVLKQPEPRVEFLDFGNSSLDFRLHFFTYEFFRIPFITSDLRFRITQLFRENGVEIPFPQQDVWFRNELPHGPEMPPKE
jgi:small-conductance mechanosensitive channel